MPIMWASWKKWNMAEFEEKGYCIASVEFKESAENDYYIYLTIEIIREDNQWKIAYYALEM